MGRVDFWGATWIHSWSDFLYFISVWFYFEEYIDITSYADDNTPYSADSNIENTVSSLESSSARLFNWFSQNAMKANPGKCHLLLSTIQNKCTNTNNNAILSSSSEKLLRITIDTNLKFDIHVNNLCKKVSRKLSALTRIASVMDVDERRSVIKDFISSHFNCCPLVWMFHD